MPAPVRSIARDAGLASLATARLWGIVFTGGEGALDSDAGQHRVGRPGQRPRLPRAHTAELLLQQTLERATRLIRPEHLMVVVSRDSGRGQDAAFAVAPGAQRIVQPQYRGSAAEVFLPLLKIARHDPDAAVVVLPGGHLVDHGARFMHYVGRAVWATRLRPDLAIVIGAQPRTAEPASGWIEPGALVEGLETLAVRAVQRFVHEPTAAERRGLFEGNGLLSTLVLIARARTLLDLGERFLPDVLEALEPLEAVFGAAEEELLCNAVYESMPQASLWRELLARHGQLAVLPIPDVMWRERRHAPRELLAAS